MESPKSIRGDVYILGNHLLMCGDSCDFHDVDIILRDAKPILMVTDPPYGVNYDASWRRKLNKVKRSIGKVDNDDKCDFSNAWSLFDGDVAYVWTSGKNLDEVKINLEHKNFKLINIIVWNKNHFAISRGDYHIKNELCLYMVRKGRKHNWQGSRKECTVWDIANRSGIPSYRSKFTKESCYGHSTQKPIECMARPIRNNTAIGESVYDPFVGSGTTLVACEQLDRVCYAMEINPIYVDMSVHRWVEERRKQGKSDAIVLVRGDQSYELEGSAFDQFIKPMSA